MMKEKTDPESITEVVIAIIQDGEGRTLMQQRGGSFAGLWEHPGGKVERGEAEEDALMREVREGTGADIDIQAPAMSCLMHNPDPGRSTPFWLSFRVFYCRLSAGSADPKVMEDQLAMHWAENPMYLKCTPMSQMINAYRQLLEASQEQEDLHPSTFTSRMLLGLCAAGYTQFWVDGRFFHRAFLHVVQEHPYLRRWARMDPMFTVVPEAVQMIHEARCDQMLSVDGHTATFRITAERDREELRATCPEQEYKFVELGRRFGKLLGDDALKAPVR